MAETITTNKQIKERPAIIHIRVKRTTTFFLNENLRVTTTNARVIKKT